MNNHQCKQCGSCFTRQEHLNRHMQSHRNFRPHVCTQCDKSFTRLDVLRRHIASHAAARLQQVSAGGASLCAHRACKQCAASRVRCTREQPSCRRCDSRSLDCIYPSRGRRKSSAAAPRALIEPTHLGEAAVQQAAHTSTSRSTMNLSNGDYTEQQTFDEGMYGWNTLDNMATGSQTGLFDPLAGLSMINWLSPETAVDIDWSTWAMQPAEMDMGTATVPAVVEGTFGGNRSGIGICDEPYHGAVLPVPSSPPPPPPPPQQQQQALPPSTPSQSQAAESAKGSTTSVPLQPCSDLSTPTEPALYVEGAAARLPFKGRGAQGNPGQDVPESLLSPNEHATADNSRDVDSLEPVTTVFSEAAYENLTHHVQTSFPNFAHALPPINCAQVFFRLYFRKFHISWPFLPSSLPYYERLSSWPVLLATVVVGARYAAGTEPRAYRHDLEMLLNTITLSLLECDDVTGSGIATDIVLSTFQASILNIICLINHGNAKALRKGKTQLYAIVDLCSGMNVFTSSPGAVRTDDRGGLEHSQEVLRTSLMIWMVDTHISCMFSSEPLLRLTDACGEMPSPPDGKAVETTPMTVPMALELLYMEKGLPPGLDDFSTNVLICAIYRRTKETVLHHHSRLSSWTPTARVQHAPQGPGPLDSTTGPGNSKDDLRPGSASGQPGEETWPPSLPILSKWRNAACDCLDILHWSANSIVARNGGWEHPVILSLHLSRLMLLTPSRQLQHMASSPLDVVRTREAWGLVAQWALSDQYKARLSVVHAGALLWHIRRYRTGGFLEPFAVYMATLVLWAYSSSLQLPITREVLNSSGPSTTTSLGATGHGSTNSADVDPTFLHLDRPLDDELVQTFVKHGSHMAGHLTGVGDIRSEGAASKILRIGVRILEDGNRLQQRLDISRDQARGRAAEAYGTQAVQLEPIWGIESVYAGRLQRLGQSDLLDS